MWTENDTERCIQYLNDQRIMREVNNDGVQYDVTDNDDGTYTHRFAWEPSKIIKRNGMFEVESVPGTATNDDRWGMPEIYTTPTRLLKWQKRFVFRLPYPLNKIWIKVVLSQENKD